MPLNNFSTTHFDTNERQQAQSLLVQLRNLLASKLVALTAEERKRYGSVNEENKKLINKVRDYQLIDPNASAPEVDWNEFALDYEDRVFLEGLALGLSSLLYEVENTKILHDYDNYQASLTDYAYTQYRAGAGIAGAIQKANELKQFFNRTGTGNSSNNNDTNTPA